MSIRIGRIVCGRSIQPAAAGDQFTGTGNLQMTNHHERDAGSIGQKGGVRDGAERIRKPLEMRLGGAIEVLLGVLPLDEFRQGHARPSVGSRIARTALRGVGLRRWLWAWRCGRLVHIATVKRG